MRKSRGISHIIFDEYHFLYEETGIRLTKYLSTSSLLATGATISILTATLPNPFRRPVMQFLDIEDGAIEIGMGECKHPDVEVNVYKVKNVDLQHDAATRIAERLKSHPNGTVHCISYFKNNATNISGLLTDGCTGCEVPNTLVHGDSGEDVFDLVSKDHSERKIEVLVSTLGAALDGPKVDYVLIAGGASGENQPVTDSQLLSSLQYVLEVPGASFREGQLESCRHVANSRTENALIGLDCGTGKSATFTVPIYAKWQYQKIDGITVVICPHRIAVRQHYEKAIYSLRNTDLSVGIFASNDIDDVILLTLQEHLISSFCLLMPGAALYQTSYRHLYSR
mmetsp:Transcript_7084/g.19793  ORF Transcript_7084/g.19793 Transcript_7084/m.19793 type:complete len:339 (-) Transcript_7084:229-1245(-)